MKNSYQRPTDNRPRSRCFIGELLLLALLLGCRPIQAPSSDNRASPLAAARVGENGETVLLAPSTTATIAQFDQLQLALTTNVKVDNPFDPTQLDLRVHFAGPNGGRMTVPAFWMQPYAAQTRQKSEPAGWFVRFAPPLAGSWQAQAELVGRGALSEPVTFAVSPSTNPGFIRIHPDNPRYFAFDNGSPYLPNGLNLGWSVGDPLVDYQRWFDELSANHGNIARVWMASWSFGIEWSDTGLGNYEKRMYQAWLLDQVFALAEERDIYLMLCLVNHGAFSTSVNPEWADNPYNDDLGGPLSAPADFVTDPIAKQFFKQRLRYIAARWAYSTNLFAWEWWNEVNWTGIRDDTLIPWIAEMTPALQEFDPYDHLTTNSSANGSTTQVWAMPEIDFSQQHDYSGGNLLRTLARDDGRINKIAPEKPLLMGELGYSAGAQVALDAMHLHIGLWGAPFLGYAGGSMYWWWDSFIDPQKQWYQYASLGRFFADENLALLTPGKATIAGGVAQALTLQNDEHALLWLVSDEYNVPAAQAAYDKAVMAAIRSKQKLTEWTYQPAQLSAVTVTLSNLHDGLYIVQWYAPTTGDWLATERVTVVQGTTTLTTPTFDADLAAKVARAE